MMFEALGRVKRLSPSVFAVVTCMMMEASRSAEAVAVRFIMDLLFSDLRSAERDC
jgi:hypothetical protein